MHITSIIAELLRHFLSLLNHIVFRQSVYVTQGTSSKPRAGQSTVCLQASQAVPTKTLSVPQTQPQKAADYSDEASIATHDSVEQQEGVFAAAFAVHGYGYPQQPGSSLLLSRVDQFPQLAGITYLDHAAATLCSKQQLQDAHKEQLQHLLANPHSQLPPGLDLSAVAIDELRLLTLNMLNAPPDEYEVRIASNLLRVAVELP
jgi:hypothetical protein